MFTLDSDNFTLKVPLSYLNQWWSLLHLDTIVCCRDWHRYYRTLTDRAQKSTAPVCKSLCLLTKMWILQGAESAVLHEEIEADKNDFCLINFIRAPHLAGVKSNNLDWRGELYAYAKRKRRVHIFTCTALCLCQIEESGLMWLKCARTRWERDACVTLRVYHVCFKWRILDKRSELYRHAFRTRRIDHFTSTPTCLLYIEGSGYAVLHADPFQICGAVQKQLHETLPALSACRNVANECCICVRCLALQMRESGSFYEYMEMLSIWDCLNSWWTIEKQQE